MQFAYFLSTSAIVAAFVREEIDYAAENEITATIFSCDQTLEHPEKSIRPLKQKKQVL